MQTLLNTESHRLIARFAKQFFFKKKVAAGRMKKAEGDGEFKMCLDALDETRLSLVQKPDLLNRS